MYSVARRQLSSHVYKVACSFILLAVIFLITILVFSRGPIPQDPSYHNFADNR